MQLQIETSSVCNAKCVFCIYPQMPVMTRPRGFMEPAVFRRVIDQAADFPLVDIITLTGLGESLLDPYLESRLEYIRTKTPFKALEVNLFTNGHTLTLERAQALHEAGLSALWVSLNATNPISRREIVGFDDYDQVVSEIHRIHEKLPSLKCIVKAVVGKDLMEPGESALFEEQWGGRSDFGGNAFLHLEGNWAGETWKMRVPPHGPCWRLFNQIMVLVDGKVTICCFDGLGKIILGDTSTSTLREIMTTSETYKEYRKAHVERGRASLPLCGQCTAI